MGNKTLMVESALGGELRVSSRQEVRQLERNAVENPEHRDKIVGMLEGYAKKRQGNLPLESLAMEAAERIAALSMLEILCEDCSIE